MQRIILLSILLFFGIHMSGTEPKYELRGVWLTTNHRLDWPSVLANNAKGREQQKAELHAILDSLQKANFNTVFFQARTRGDLFYPSAIEPWSVYLTGQYGKNPGYDPLTFVIDECHKRGMECHAWFVTFPVGNDLQVKQMGKQSPVKRKPKLCKRYNGEWYLDPGEPGTADYLRSLVKEIVQKYDIDGIHFDYIRYPENPKGFPDAATYRKYGKKAPLAEWRRQNITRIENMLYDEVKRLKPHVLVSSSPLGKYQRLPQYPNIGWTGVESVYQDAGKWLREEKCDFAVPMMYYLHEHFFPFVDNWVAQCGKGFIAPGLGIYRLNEPGWCLNDITDQIDYGRFHNTKGNVFFRCKNLLSDTELYKTLQEEYYRYPALIPYAQTSDDILPPQNITVQKTDGTLTFSWEDPSGLTEPIYLLYRCPVGEEMEKARLIAQSIGITTLTIPAGKKDTATYYLTVYNRRRNESRPSATIRP
ncbi:MAG: family 10 glycosylhydrolase [Bacteroidales bacterium]|nr:family 10 glycosylhydrolase [Bacteroidales bacterium]